MLRHWESVEVMDQSAGLPIEDHRQVLHWRVGQNLEFCGIRAEHLSPNMSSLRANQ